jgi:hypothetical protein
MPADDELDPLDRWLSQPAWPMSPPPGTFERVTRRARRRRARKTLTAAASAAAVVAAVAVAVPLGLSGGLGRSPSGNSVAAGRSTAPSGQGSQSVEGSATGTTSPGPAPTHAHSPAAASATSGAATGTAPTGITSPGYLPGNFRPSSVTWVSQYTGYIIGQAGTAGSCGARGNSDICTSIAVTHDTGQTWKGLAAPPAGAASGLTGVSGLRFLNADYGWAYGPELWYTTDGTAAEPTWKQEKTGGQAVTDLETANGQAFAIFASCPSGLSMNSVAYQCTSYTLKTSVAGSDRWTDVSGVPAGLKPDPVDHGQAELVIGGSAVYLITPQNVLYTASLDGGGWTDLGGLPCTAGESYLNNDLANPVELATAGPANGSARLALICAHEQDPAGAETVLFTSADGGRHWARQRQLGSDGSARIGSPVSVAGDSAGTVMVATSAGIWYLPLGGTRWQRATIGGSASAGGFSYIGMTTPSQGVALSSDPGAEAIWLTQDGGQSWTPEPIKR